ncbi:hypothetical protein HETIRDRAFT_447769 [Heterobasidion irregulare TC 32-1]|uniref:Uncharacterized protein n=1 Tax=Heterobasidion irregulare (strain TC 32-1) TaxID=747525 RepID=W4KP85_HETIT|nr:uncharacterized protein HETIRDRAFT_447769 [Heterobasidion irregulare TC 32-1]ETW87200.1 hypothetical protein HETIRDRAFT_447769 [Heterobasidion irregulare TC 32-1]
MDWRGSSEEAVVPATTTVEGDEMLLSFTRRRTSHPRRCATSDSWPVTSIPNNVTSTRAAHPLIRILSPIRLVCWFPPRILSSRTGFHSATNPPADHAPSLLQRFNLPSPVRIQSYILRFLWPAASTPTDVLTHSAVSFIFRVCGVADVGAPSLQKRLVAACGSCCDRYSLRGSSSGGRRIRKLNLRASYPHDDVTTDGRLLSSGTPPSPVYARVHAREAATSTRFCAHIHSPLLALFHHDADDGAVCSFASQSGTCAHAHGLGSSAAGKPPSVTQRSTLSVPLGHKRLASSFAAPRVLASLSLPSCPSTAWFRPWTLLVFQQMSEQNRTGQDATYTEEKGARVINTSARYKDLAFAFPAAWTVQLAVLTPLIAPGEHAWTQVPYLEQRPPEGFERAFPCLSSLPPPPASSHSRIWPGLTAVQTILTARTRHGPRLRRSPAARPLWACEDALARARDPTKHAEGVEEAGRVAGARKHARANVLWRILERRPLRIPLVQPSFLSQQRMSAWLWPTRSLASNRHGQSVGRAGGRSASFSASAR